MATIQAQQQTIYEHGQQAACFSASATFITLTALTVIGCAALCLTLPGVNVMSHFVIPVIIPAGTALLASIPCWVLASRASQKQTPLIEALIQQLKTDLDTNLPPMLGSDRRDWIHAHALPLDQGFIDGSLILQRLIQLYPEKIDDQGPNDKLILRALNQTLAKLLQHAPDNSTPEEWTEKITKARANLDIDNLIPNLRAQDDAWEDEHIIAALRDLADTYPAGDPPPPERTAILAALDSLGTGMYSSNE